MNALLNWHSEFPILERTTYLISNSLGAMPCGVYDRLRDYADTWATRGVRAWEEGWWEMAVAVGDKAGALVGAGSGEISLHQNVTLTQASNEEILATGAWKQHLQVAAKAAGA